MHEPVVARVGDEDVRVGEDGVVREVVDYSCVGGEYEIWVGLGGECCVADAENGNDCYVVARGECFESGDDQVVVVDVDCALGDENDFLFRGGGWGERGVGRYEGGPPGWKDQVWA